MPEWLVARARAFERVRIDQLVAVALLIAIELQVWLGHAVHNRVFVSLVGVALAWAVSARRRWPLAAVFVITALMSVRILTGAGDNLQGIAGVSISVVLLFYGLGAFAPPRRSVWMLALAVVITTINSLTKPGGGVSAVFPMEVFGILLPYALGRAMLERGARERESRAAAEELDAARESSARDAADRERARIARELHDVIAHSVSVMVIHAGGARLVMDDAPERAEQSLRSVERAGREALAEMRRLLGILGDGDPRALAPQPGLADIASLLARAQTSGLSADLHVVGDPVPVSPALDLCAYRVVQEALTNAIKHAAPARASVNVRWQPAVLELEVSDDGSGHSTANVAAAGGGHGIVGMRERVSLHSGTLEAGVHRGGGFTARARLPLGERA
jgi:signal transduction histidine kinase